MEATRRPRRLLGIAKDVLAVLLGIAKLIDWLRRL
jgi:hypothetical protein